jgi:hypothetical protein
MTQFEYSADVTVNVIPCSESARANLRNPDIGAKTLPVRTDISHSYSSRPAVLVIDQYLSIVEAGVGDDRVFSVSASLQFVLNATMNVSDFLDYLDGHELHFDGCEATLVCSGAAAEPNGVEEDASEDADEQ